MDKPTAEQTAWVFKHVLENLMEGGTYRKLIYDRMGYDPKDYKELSDGMAISNLLSTTRQSLKNLADLIDTLHGELVELKEKTGG